MVAGRAGLGGTGGRGPAPGNPPLHGQGLPQERCEDGLLVVVGQQEDALDQEAPHLPVVHHGQVHQDGAQDLWHLGAGGGASPGSPALRGLLPSPRRTPLLLPRWTLGRRAHLGPGTARPFQSILWSLRRFYHILTWEVPRFRRASLGLPAQRPLTDQVSFNRFFHLPEPDFLPLFIITDSGMVRSP